MERLTYRLADKIEKPIKEGGKRKRDVINQVGDDGRLSMKTSNDLLARLNRPLSSNGSVSDGRTSVETVESSGAETVESSGSERGRKEFTQRPTLFVLPNNSDSETEFDDSPEAEASFCTTPWNTFKANLLAIGVESEIDYGLFSTFKEMGFVLPSGELNEGIDLRDALSILKEHSQTRQGRSGRGERGVFAPKGSKKSGLSFKADRDRISIEVKRLKN